MEDWIRIFGLLLTAGILCLLLRRTGPEFGTAAAVAGCLAGTLLLLKLCSPLLEFVRALSAQTGIDRRFLAPVLKSVGIGALTQFTAAFCEDCGQATLAKVAVTGGTVLVLCVCLPLFQAVLSLTAALSGG